jgi:RHS repeat-associated protein
LRTTASGTGAEAVVKHAEWASFGAWLFRPTRETLEGSVSGKLRESYRDYEAKTGNLRATEQWLEGGSNPRLSMTYDDVGNPVAVTNALGHVTFTEYDAETRTFPVRVRFAKTGAVEHVKAMEVDVRFGKPAATIDANGNRTRYAYDVFGRLVERRSADGGEKRVEYRDEELPACVLTRIKESEAGGFIRGCQYLDGLGRTIQTVSFGEGQKPIVTRSFYDALGRNHYSAGPYFAAAAVYPQPVPSDAPWVKTAVDRRGRVVKIETPDTVNGTAAVGFTFSGLAATVTDPDGAGKTEIKDYLGRVVAVIEHAEAGDARTTYAYNAAGDLLSVTNALGQAVAMTYDSLGRKIGMKDPDMGSWSYAYDAAGRLVAQTDAKGQKIGFAYDGLGRVLSKAYSTNDPAVSYVYDGPAANGIGRLYQVKNDNAVTTYKAYDSQGRVLEVSRGIKGAPRSEYSTHYAYDASGRLISTLYPDNYQVAYNYHPATGLLKSVIGITDFTEYAQFDSYDAAGRARYVYHGNGTATSYGFDAVSGRLQSIATEGPDLAQIQKKTYRYSAAGDILGIGDESAKGSVSRSYQYDRRHRLVAETSVGAQESFQQALITPVFDDRFPLHGPKGLAAAGLEYGIGYDANGNMVRLPDLSEPNRVRERYIAYNADNMPVRIAYDGESGAGGGSGSAGGGGGGGGGGGCFIGVAHAASAAPATVELFYDGEGRRVIKRVHGTRLTFYVSGHFEVVDGIETKYIFAGGLRIAKVSSGTQHFFHKDHLGSSTLITDNENGRAVETADFLPFGLTRNHTGAHIARHTYTDQEEDAETGLYNYNARLYDPALGMFISPDSIVQNPFDPQALNRYAYARNNPLKYIDPSGHVFVVDDLIVGAVIGAAIGAAIAGYQSGWDPKAMAIGAGIGAVAGYMGFAGNALATEAALAAGCGSTTTAIAGATVGGAAAGATSGGLSAAVYGGDVTKGILMGGGIGALAGFSFGAIDSAYSGRWSLDRVAAHTALGGGLSELSGDKFYNGALFALVTSMSAYTYNEAVGYDLTWESGGEAVEKGRYDMPVKGANNAGTQSYNLDRNGWINEGGRVSRVVNNTPGGNATSGLHDVFQVTIDKFFGAYGETMRNILNVPGMIPAAVITYAGLMSGSTPTIYYLTGR